MVRLLVEGVAQLLVDLLLEVLAGGLVVVLLRFQLFADRLQELVRAWEQMVVLRAAVDLADVIVLGVVAARRRVLVALVVVDGRPSARVRMLR